jgi:hypothetical protein
MSRSLDRIKIRFNVFTAKNLVTHDPTATTNLYVSVLVMSTSPIIVKNHRAFQPNVLYVRVLILQTIEDVITHKEFQTSHRSKKNIYQQQSSQVHNILMLDIIL